MNRPVISVSGVGKVKKDAMIKTGGARPGMDIVVSKWIGIEGTVILAKERERELARPLRYDLYRPVKGSGCIYLRAFGGRSRRKVWR